MFARIGIAPIFVPTTLDVVRSTFLVGMAAQPSDPAKKTAQIQPVAVFAVLAATLRCGKAGRVEQAVLPVFRSPKASIGYGAKKPVGSPRRDDASRPNGTELPPQEKAPAWVRSLPTRPIWCYPTQVGGWLPVEEKTSVSCDLSQGGLWSEGGWGVTFRFPSGALRGMKTFGWPQYNQPRGKD